MAVTASLRVDTLPTSYRQDIRAAHRTFEGAYIRTAVSHLSFGLVVLRLFSREFLGVGTVYTVQSILMLLLAYYQRNRVEHQFEASNFHRFITSGKSVILSTIITLGAHISLLVILFRMDD